MNNYGDGSTAQPAPYWEVVSVQEGTLLMGARGIVPSKILTIRLNTDGSTFTLEVPRDEFSAAQLASKIDQQVRHELDVRDLKGPPMPA